HTEKLEKLLWRPIDPNTVFRQGYLSPTSAVEMLLMNYEPQEPNWPTSALRALLQAKAELDRPENTDLLILAVKFGQTGYVQMLLDHRANVHGSADPWTPLDMACEYHPEDLSGHAPRPGLITMLLTAQADPEPMLRDASSWVLNPTPTDYFRLATPRMLGDTVALACAAVTETYVLSASLCSAAYTGNTQNVRWLLEMQVQADAHVCTSILKGRPDLVRNERQQRTALGLAAANGHCTTTQALLEARADTNLSLDGYPPLHRAALHGAPAAIISSILAAAGKVNGKDKLGRTALTLAVLWTGARDTTVIRILLEAKADRFHRDYNGHTPLSTAAKCPSAELTELMQIPEEEEDARAQTPNNLHCLYTELQQCRSSDSSEEEI
ncbi:caiap, partial [Symbiodinium sp. KB8]